MVEAVVEGILRLLFWPNGDKSISEPGRNGQV